jgi:hypothetical protein
MKNTTFVISQIEVCVNESRFGYLHMSSDTEKWEFVPYANYASTVDARNLRAIAVKLDELNGEKRAK